METKIKSHNEGHGYVSFTIPEILSYAKDKSGSSGRMMAHKLFIDYATKNAKEIFNTNSKFVVKEVDKLHSSAGNLGTLLSFDFDNGNSLPIKKVIELVKKNLKADCKST